MIRNLYQQLPGKIEKETFLHHRSTAAMICVEGEILKHKNTFAKKYYLVIDGEMPRIYDHRPYNRVVICQLSQSEITHGLTNPRWLNIQITIKATYERICEDGK